MNQVLQQLISSNFMIIVPNNESLEKNRKSIRSSDHITNLFEVIDLNDLELGDG